MQDRIKGCVEKDFIGTVQDSTRDCEGQDQRMCRIGLDTLYYRDCEEYDQRLCRIALQAMQDRIKSCVGQDYIQTVYVQEQRLCVIGLDRARCCEGYDQRLCRKVLEAMQDKIKGCVGKDYVYKDCVGQTRGCV